MKLTEKHIVITGGSRGIGRGLAQHFLKAGCRITINGRSWQQLDETVKDLQSRFGNDHITGFQCDVTDRASMEEFCSRAVEAFGDIDVWINNAGIDQQRENFWELNEMAYTSVFRTNVEGVIHGSAVAARQMLKQGSGRIYNMEGFGSDGRTLPGMSIYGASKRAVRYLTESFALELEDEPVSIGLLSPGMVMTDFLRKGLPDDPVKRESTQKIYNILADEVEDVTAFLSAAILKDRGRKKRIAWLTTGKIARRFMISPLYKRDFFN